MQFKLTQNEIKENPFIKDGKLALYNLICEKAKGLSIDSVSSIDPTKIYCSEGVFDISEKAFSEENPLVSKETFGMAWVNYGPKVDTALPDWTIAIEDGAIEA